MASDIFPIGRFSRQDLEQFLNNGNTRYQAQNSSSTASFIKTFYGFGYVLGNSASPNASTYVTFSLPINNIISVHTTSLGFNGSTQTPTGITGTSLAGTSCHAAGISSAGFSARLIGNANLGQNTAYVFNWMVFAKVR